MDGFAWTVVGSLAGVVCAVTAIVFGIAPLMQARHARRASTPEDKSRTENAVTSSESISSVGRRCVIVGDVPREPAGFVERQELAALVDWRPERSRVAVVRSVTGLRGVGKTQLAAAVARSRIERPGWQFVGWVNAEDEGLLLAGLAEAAEELGLSKARHSAAGMSVRHWLETDGKNCLIVFDNVTDVAMVEPFIPAAGGAMVIVTSTLEEVVQLGVGVPVGVFEASDAVSFLTERTGLGDVVNAAELARQLGCLPLALAQAAAVIASQRLDYRTYLERLAALPVGDVLAPVRGGQYRQGVAAALLLAIDAAREMDRSGLATELLDLLAVMSPVGMQRSLLQAAGEAGLPGAGVASAAVIDSALGRLAGVSLVTFSTDASVVSIHRLVRRTVRERLDVSGGLAGVCIAAAKMLDSVALPLSESRQANRAAKRDVAQQAIALYETASKHREDDELTVSALRVKSYALFIPE